MIRYPFSVLAISVMLGMVPPIHAETKSDNVAKAVAEEDKTKFIDLPRRWDLSIYTIIVFLLLFFFLHRYAWPNILTGLKKREMLIEEAKLEAIAAKAAAERARLDLEAKMAEANDTIRAMLEEGRRDADALRAKEREVGQKEAAAERDRAKREIESAKNQALNEIYEKSVDLATMISTKAVKRSMTPDDHRRPVDESLAELNTGKM